MKREVVVTGASGFIGSTVVRRLVAGGFHIIGLSQDPKRASAAAAHEIQWLPIGAASADEAVARVGKVINLAGAHPFARRWTDGYKRVIRASRVDTTQRLVAALASNRAPDRVLVNASGIWCYGDSGATVVSDDRPVHDDGFLRAMLRDWEAAARTAESSGTRVAIMRIGLAFGRGGGPLAEVEGNFRRFLGGHAGNGRQYVPWIHVDDMAEMIVRALEDGRWSGAYLGAAPNPVTFAELARQIGGAMGRPSWFHPPRLMLRLMVGEASALLLESYRTHPARALAHDFVFRYTTFADAIRAIFAPAAAAEKQALAS